MKLIKFTFSIILGLILCTSAQAQINTTDLNSLKNTATFTDGEDVLRQILAITMIYPKEIEKDPRYCSMIGYIKFSKDVKIVESGSINKVEKPFINAFKEVAQTLEYEDWTLSNDTADFFYAVIPIEFRTLNLSYETDYTNMPDYFMSPVVCSVLTEIKDFKEDKDILDLVNENFSSGKALPAQQALEGLITRQPYNADYITKLLEISKEVSGFEDAAFYEEYLKLLIK